MVTEELKQALDFCSGKLHMIGTYLMTRESCIYLTEPYCARSPSQSHWCCYSMSMNIFYQRPTIPVNKCNAISSFHSFFTDWGIISWLLAVKEVSGHGYKNNIATACTNTLCDRLYVFVSAFQDTLTIQVVKWWHMCTLLLYTCIWACHLCFFLHFVSYISYTL